jgi:hypothetical protein
VGRDPGSRGRRRALVGGAIAGGISWHWIFWLNVPIGLALMPLAARRLSESFGPRPQLDLVGLVLAGVAAFGVTWALVRAESVGWGSVEIIGSLAGGLVLAGLFVNWERRARTPMLQLEFFRDRASHDVPARLRPPGGAFELLGEQVHVRDALGRPHELLLPFRHVSREALEPVREQPRARRRFSM